jgi:peptidoglycan/LPS O-acetylase OafA/YrhL
LLSEAPTETPQRVPRGHRRADVQGIRAVAVLLVVVFHAGAAARGGFVGVDVFFVVSGFVIAGLLLRELGGTSRFSFAAFYLRRIRRLLPALALVSVFTLVAGAVLVSPIGGGQQALGRAVMSATRFAANGFFFTSTGGYFQRTAESNPFLHTWTLSVEEQFYLVFPALLLFAWWRGRRSGRRWLVGLLLAALLGSLATALAFSYDRLPGAPVLGRLATPDLALQFAFYSPLTRGWEFLAGALIALVPTRWTPRPRLAAALGLTGVALLAIAAFGLRPTDRFPGVLAALPVGAAAGLLLAGLAPVPTAVTRLLSARPAVLLGDLSYSWYLWHWPVIVLARTWWPGDPWIPVAAAAGSLVPAALSYRLVERPIHRGRRLVSRRATLALAVACVAIPLVAGLGLVTAANRSWGRPGVAHLRALTDPEHLDMVAGCAGTAPLGAVPRPGCTWTVPGARGTVLLIGDSNAGHLTEPVIAAGRELGYDVEVVTSGGCPFLVRPRYFNADCERFVKGSLAAILARRQPYAAVVVSNASLGYLNGPLAPDFAGDAPSRTGGPDRQRVIAGWAADLRITVTPIAGRGPVVVVGAVPQFANLPQCLMPSLLAGPTPGCGGLSADTARRTRADIVTAERPVTAAAGAGYLDTGQTLCRPTGECSAFVNGIMVYRDEAHLSVSGAMLFEPGLRDALRATSYPAAPHA